MTITCVIFQCISALALLESKTLESFQPQDNAASSQKPFKVWGALGVQWFLLCLVAWRFILPVWMMLRYPLLSAVVCGCLVQFTDAFNTNFHSGITFFPFFVAGHLTSPEALAKVRRPAVLAGFMSFVVIVIAGSALLANSSLPGPALRKAAGLAASSYACFMNIAPRNGTLSADI